MIRCEKISRSFQRDKRTPPILAVENLDLEVRKGEVFGFLGPNGAGKTTTLRILACLIAPTSGRGFINGLEIGRQNQEIRNQIGILTETPGMYERLSAYKNLEIFARLYGVEDVPAQVQKYLGMLGLWERRFDPAGSFSRGMKQKLAIARALLHEPKILFLDEPTSNLDPEAAHLVRDFIMELIDEGKTIFLCTHNLDEAERLCQRVAIFKTHLLALDTPVALRQRLFGRKVVFHLKNLDPLWEDQVKAFPFVKDAQKVENRLVVSLDDPEEGNPILVRHLAKAGADIQFVGEYRHSLEDIYLEMMQNDSTHPDDHR